MLDGRDDFYVIKVYGESKKDNLTVEFTISIKERNVVEVVGQFPIDDVIIGMNTYRVDNLDQYYQVNTRYTCNILYDIYVDNVKVIGNSLDLGNTDVAIYNNSEKNIVLEDGSNLVVNGDYRSNLYNVKVEAYVESYQESERRVDNIFRVYESAVPQIVEKDNIVLEYYNVVLSNIDLNVSNLYRDDLYPFWEHVEFYMEGYNRDELDSNTGVVRFGTELNDNHANYNIVFEAHDPESRYREYSSNRNITMYLHELGRIRDVGSVDNYSMEDYGLLKVINVDTIYNVFVDEGFVQDGKMFDEVVDIRSNVSLIDGSVKNDSNLVDVKTDFGSVENINYFSNLSYNPKFKFQTDVRDRV